MTSQILHQAQKAKNSSNSWRVMTLGEVGEIVSGGTPSTAIPEYWGGEINWISPSDLTGYKEKTIKKGAKSITKLGLKNSSARVIPEGSVLFSSRAPIGYVAIASEKLSTNQGFKSIVPHEFVLSEYLYYFLSASKQQAEKVASGTTFKEISKSKFAELQIPVPNLDIQQSIVSKIEELLSELDKGVESLKLAQQQLKVYRQSVLKWAFDYIQTNQDAFVEDCCTHVVDCLHSTAKFAKQGYYCVDTTCIEQGKIIFEKIRYVTKETFVERISRLKPEPGDILFSREGTVGTTVIVPNNIELCLGQRMMMFRLKKNISSKYFMYYFQSPHFKSQYQPLIMGTTAPHLNIRDIRKFLVKLCPFERQLSIVSNIEDQLSITDKMEESINQSLQQAEVMRQSILKRAFEGILIK